MKGLILAAGYGSRLREVSDSKPLTSVSGTPLIEQVMAAAAEAGVREFVVVTGHAAGKVEDFAAALAPRLGIAVECVRAADWSRPNGYSLLDGAGRMEGDFLLLMSDHLFDPEIVRRLLAVGLEGQDLCLAVDRDLQNPLLDMDDATKVEVGAGGEIVRIGKTIEPFNAIDTGIFLATPALPEAIRADIDSGGGGSLSEGVQRLADSGRARVMDIGPACWIDVDDPRSLEVAERLLARGALSSSVG